MKTLRFRLAATVGVVAVLAVVIVAIAAATRGGHGIKEKLTGYQENPALSTTGHGKFRLTIDRKAQEMGPSSTLMFLYCRNSSSPIRM